MLRRSEKSNNQAQIFLEYTIISGIVIMILLSMNTMIKRGIQGMVKSVADQIGLQINAEQNFNEVTGYVESKRSTTYAFMNKTTREFFGITNYIYNAVARRDSTTVSHLGFTEE
ncbi:MAG: hypothetical protein KAR31_02980 [Candidatus Omnitrophica bacterium]|nr:hypothetical protein [Candidatus Omnitrophota bacterium]